MSDGLEVIIVTGDRDLLQLVNDQVKVLVPVKGFGQTKIYTRELVKQEFGVEPAQWVDVKALKGDSSDNYPGVRGIGPKTAQDLIAKFGNLENLYKHLDELQLKLKLKLAEGVEDAGLSKKLATIVAGVPGVKLQLDKVAVAEIDWEAGAKYMREKLGFRSLADRIQNLKFKGQNSNSKVKSEDKNEAASVADSGEPRQLGLI
jgi:DNA polymerase-1